MTAKTAIAMIMSGLWDSKNPANFWDFMALPHKKDDARDKAPAPHEIYGLFSLEKFAKVPLTASHPKQA